MVGKRIIRYRKLTRVQGNEEKRRGRERERERQKGVLASAESSSSVVSSDKGNSGGFEGGPKFQ